MDEPSKDNQIIYVWECDSVKCLDSPLTLQILTFILIYSLGHVFVVSELFILWVKMLPWKGHGHHRFQSSPVTIFNLCCFCLPFATLHWSMATLWGCVQMLITTNVLLLISTVFSPACSERTKNLKKCFNLLPYAYTFIYRHQMHWLLYQNGVTTTTKQGFRDTLWIVLRTAPQELPFPTGKHLVPATVCCSDFIYCSSRETPGRLI